MRLAAFLTVALAAVSLASIIPCKEDRVQADETFLKYQRRILDLLSGLGHSDHFKHEHEHFDFMAHADKWTNPEVPKKFYTVYKRGFLPKDQIFSMMCPRVRYETMLLFDLFYFTNDFETFYGAACWAKLHVNPAQFYFAFRSAMQHHEMGKHFHVPPMYEIFPSLFVPQTTMHKAYDEKMMGSMEGHFHFNATGAESSYHDGLFGGLFGRDSYTLHLENKASHFREDVVLNAAFADFALRNGAWMMNDKYNHTIKKWGEISFFKNQQLLARYALERMALKMPNVQPLTWSKPITAGYNPKISYLNGESFLTRPDNFMPEKSPNTWLIRQSQKIEKRLMDAIDAGQLWIPEEHGTPNEHMNLTSKDGVNILGYAMGGGIGHKFYGNYYWQTLDALSSLVKTKDDHSFKGGVVNTAMAAIRDPVFFSFLGRYIQMFNSLKKHMHPYRHADLFFPGVTVKSFEADKLVTYVEKFDFEITNGLSVKDPNEYKNVKYYASQDRLNHKPYTFKINVNSEKEMNAIVTIFMGPHRNSEFEHLSLEQKRLMFVVMDRFLVKLKAGENMIERSSKESNYAFSEQRGFRDLYHRLDSAMKGTEQFFKAEGTCGFPEHLQLPIGSPSGTEFTFAVVITPAKDNVEQIPKGRFCMYPRLNDDKPMFFPFDRTIHDETHFHVPNIRFENMRIYSKPERDINRP